MGVNGNKKPSQIFQSGLELLISEYPELATHEQRLQALFEKAKSAYEGTGYKVVQYVGMREVYNDHLYKSGSWVTKQVKNVAPAISAKLLRHPDLFGEYSPVEAPKEVPKDTDEAPNDTDEAPNDSPVDEEGVDADTEGVDADTEGFSSDTEGVSSDTEVVDDQEDTDDSQEDLNAKAKIKTDQIRVDVQGMETQEQLRAYARERLNGWEPDKRFVNPVKLREAITNHATMVGWAGLS